MPPPRPVPRNQAFISFAREDNQDAGRRWADWAAQILESFDVPQGMAGRPTPAGPVPPQIAPIGRSGPEQEISAKQRSALVESRTLVVICSPAAAKSARVTEEVRLFKQFSQQGRVLALIVEGDPEAEPLPGTAGPAKHECFPETLRYEVRNDGTVDREWRVQPVVVDVRIDGKPGFTAQGTYLAVLNSEKKAPAEENQKRAEEYGARLEEARRTLIAGVLGVPPGELENAVEEVTVASGRTIAQPQAAQGAKGRRGVRFSSVVIFLLLLVAGGLGWLANYARQQQTDAEAARDRANRLIVFLQRDLHQKLTPSGNFALAAGANEQIIQYLRGLARDSKDPEILGALADALGHASDLWVQQENMPAAYETAREAVQVRQRVLALPNAPMEQSIQQIADLRRVAEISRKVQKIGDALTVIEQARTLAEKLTRLGDSGAVREAVRSHYAAAAILQEAGKLDEGTSAALLGRDLAKKYAAGPQTDSTWQEEVIRGSEQLGEIYQRSGNFPNALAEYREAQRLIADLAARDTKDMALQTRLAKIHMRMGNLLASQQRFKEASGEFRPAVVCAERAARQQPASVEAQFEYVMACRRLGEILASAEPTDRSEALLYFQKAIEHLETRFPGDITGRAPVLKKDIERLRDEVMR